MKEETSNEKLCENLPDELKKDFVTMLDYAMSIKYEEEPKYDYMIELLKECKKRHNIEDDNDYYW